MNSISQFYRRFKKSAHSRIISLLILSISMSVAFLLLVYVQNESSYDSYNKNINNLYILRQTQMDTNAEYSQTPPAFCDYIKQTYPEVKQTCLVIETWGSYLKSEEADQFYEEDGFYADNSVFSLFTYEFTDGNSLNALKNPYSIVLSQSLATKLFPKGDVLGQTVIVDNNYPLTVTGIYKDLPYNMHIHPSYLCTFDLYNDAINKDYRTSVRNQAFKTYALIPDKNTIPELNNKVQDLYKNQGEELSLKPYFRLVSKESDNSNILFIYKISAFLLILLSGFNYINTSIVNTLSQSKELGIKKVIGANKFYLLKSMLTEIILVTCIIFLVTTICTKIMIPVFDHFMENPLITNVYYYKKWIALLSALSLAIIGLSLVIPTFRIFSTSSNFLMKSSGNKSSKPVLRNTMLGIEFIICICFIVFTLVMHKQVNFITNKDIGFHPENIVFANPYSDEDNSQWKQTLKENLLKVPGVRKVSFSMCIPFYGNSGITINVPQSDERISASRNIVDVDYFNTFGMQLINGHFFDAANNNKDKCIITEKTARLLGLENAVGQWINVGRNNTPQQIIGVIKNHEHYSIKSESPAMIYTCNQEHQDYTNKIAIALQPNTGKNTLAEITNLTKSLYPKLSFEYWDYSAMVNEERGTNYLKNVNSLFSIFSAIALFVSLLGLYNMIAQNILQKTKEIGIRKVNGARIIEILQLLNQSVIKIVLITGILAVPLSYYVIHQWLNEFVYKTEVSWWVFAISGITTLFIALCTVSWQSWKAATSNPVDALRNE